MTKGFPPSGGYYFSSQEPGAGTFKSVFSAVALKKFSSAPCTKLLYASGPIKIFDVSRIEDGSCTPGPDSRSEGKKATT